MKILVCGDRNWIDGLAIKQEIWNLVQATKTVPNPSKPIVIEGEAKGADKLARRISEMWGWEVVKVEAKWKKYGRSAGPIRNREMLDMKPDIVIAFHDDIGNSKGTKDCINEAINRGISVKLFTHKEGLKDYGN